MHISKCKLLALSAFLSLLFSGFTKITVKKYVEVTDNLTIDFDKQLTSPLIHPPYISAVLNDVTDPLYAKGIIFDVLKNGVKIDPNFFIVSATSDNNEVINNQDIDLIKTLGRVNLKIKKYSGIGYSNIRIQVKSGHETSSIEIYCAVSKNKIVTNCFWHTGISDASAAIPIDSTLMLVADDEKNQICLYKRFESGLPLSIFNYDKYLNLTDGEEGNYKEVDCEAAAQSLTNSNIVYWMGSMSNGGKYDKIEKNRNWVFSTEINKKGKETALTVKGEYNQLRASLIKWGDTYGFHFSSCAESGKNPKSTDGFNIEGICFGPDSTSLYIGFRAPNIAKIEKQYAVLAPLLNFEKWFNNGKVNSTPDFGKPIILDLKNRGIRDIIRLNNGKYLIVAGNSDEKSNPALYYWTGLQKDDPLEIPTSYELGSLRPETGIEILDNSTKIKAIQLLSDNGKEIYYNDGANGKYLPFEYKKFCSNIIDISTFISNVESHSLIPQ